MYDTAAEVRIRRLSLHDPQGRAETVRAVLAAADWPPTATGEVLVLRRLRVAGRVGEIGALAAAAARALAARAVDADDPRAPAADAVRFCSRDHLLACLATDLLATRAASLWFWRTFSDLFGLPPPAAVARALAREPLSLPAVTARLAGTATWRALWQGLTPTDARDLLAAIRRDTGWAALAGSALPAGTGSDTPTPSPHRSPQDGHRFAPDDRPPLPSGLSSEDQRVRLAAVLALWRRSPHVLARPEGTVALADVAHALVGAAATPTPVDRSAEATPAEKRKARSAPRPSAPLPAPDGPAASEAFSPPSPPSQAQAQAAAEQNRPPSPPGTQRAEPLASDIRPARREATTRLPSAPDMPEPAQVPHPAARPDTASATRDTEPDPTPIHTVNVQRLVTGCGGLFYLLNLLALPAAQVELAPDARPGLAAGWIWLYQLGCALGCSPDEPLVRFLAAEAGLDYPQALEAQAPVAALPALLRLGATRFGDAVFNRNLCAQPALAVATPSHLDVHYRMRDLRLDVRRVALDVDPGWLPWLGRVVRFHYGPVPELDPWDRP